jgi:hypothetical protein
MGDRGEVVLVESDSYTPIRLYTHWGASSLPYVVADALRRGTGRWNDPSYLNRIIFSEMIKGDVLGETGYGISNIGAGDAWLHVIVNHEEQTVHVDSTGEVYSFADYIRVYPEE